MIGYFPTPYPDELFYSTIARYGDHTLQGYSQSCADLLGRARFSGVRISVFIPNKINRFVKHIGASIHLQADDIIQNHTLFPYLSKFGPLARSEKLYQFMIDENIGFPVCVAKESRNAIRFCPVCVGHDRQTYGEAFWHRSHNIPSVNVCTKHHCKLKVWMPPVEKFNLMKCFSAESMIIDDHLPEFISSDSSYDIDYVINSILNGDEAIKEDEIISLALAKGYVVKLAGGLYFRQEFMREFDSFIKTKYKQFQSLTKITRTQVRQILNKKWNGRNPIMILLLEQFLLAAKEKVANHDVSVKCINKLCGYHTRLIGRRYWKSRKVQYKTQRGFEVQCPFCGMKYLGSFEKEPYLLILDYGSLVKKEIDALYSRGYSFKQIGSTLGMSPKGARNIHRGVFRSYKKVAILNLEPVRKKRRSFWLKALKSPKFSSITKIYKTRRSEYRWLLRHDKEWLKKNIKFRILTESENLLFKKDKNKARVLRERKKLDNKALIELKKIYKFLIDSNVKRRISRHLFTSLMKNVQPMGLKLLVKSNEFVNEFQESQHDYFKRRTAPVLRNSVSRLISH